MEERKLKILFLTPRYPFPLIGGDRVKPFNMLKHLAQVHDVTHVGFYQGADDYREFQKAIESLGVESYVIKLNPVVGAIRGVLPKLFSCPLEIGYYTQPDFRNQVESLCNENSFDLAFAFFMRTAEYIRHLPVKKILVAEDCRTLYQKRSYESTKNIKQKIVRCWEYKRLLKYEPQIVNDFDLTTLVTQNDILSMQKLNPAANYRLLTNGTDMEKFFPPSQSSGRKDILFAGKLDIWANVLMIKDIISNLLPEIRKAVPDVKLKIVGANPSKTIKELTSENIEVYGDVPDMVPFLQNARVFLHPHIGGSGIQNKLLEAMACGCPIVTTPTGIQGIPGEHGNDVMIGKNNSELIENTIAVLKDDELMNKLSVNSCSLIRRTHSWESVFSNLDKLILEVMNS